MHGVSLRAKLRGLTGSDMLRDVLKLVSGTVGGRLIALAALPLATRLYTPEDFALLAVYLGVVGMGGVVACLRLDVAIPVAHDDQDAAHLLVLALLIALTFTTLVLIAILTAPHALAGLLGQMRLAPWLWMIPPGILMAANYSALQFWATRMRRFGSIAITRVTQATTGAATMLVLGWAGIAPFGLLLGNMLSTSAGGLRLGREALRAYSASLRRVTRPGLVAAFRSYRRFPIYSVPDALANMAGTQVPVMIVAAHAGAEAGFLLLAQQIMTAPMTLLGSSIAQVYLSRAPEEMRKGQLAEFTLGILSRLMQTGVGPLVLAGLLAPSVFPLIFGAQWTRAGEIVAMMVPWMALQLLGSPISTVMYIADRQRAMLALTLFGGALRVGAVVTAIGAGRDLVSAFVGSSVVFYGACLLVCCRAAGLGLGRGERRLLIYLILILGAYGAFQAISSGWLAT
nr:oligosaccharide flippase family protein [Sphingomonas sp. Y57]